MPISIRTKNYLFLEEGFCPGINDLKTEMGNVLPATEITSIRHDDLIARLDSISNLFEVVIIKNKTDKTPILPPSSNSIVSTGTATNKRYSTNESQIPEQINYKQIEGCHNEGIPLLSAKTHNINIIIETLFF